MKRPLLFSLILLFSLLFSAIVDAENKDSATIKVSGYVDAYYAYYTDSVGIGNYQKFPSVDARSNSFGLNHAMITAQYDGDKFRGIVTAHYGDIPRSAWSSTFNGIMEAHAGVRLCSKLWLDAGFFRTHTGAEGLLPKENFTSSVSVSTYFEPYYESGFRLDYHPSSKLSIDLYFLNGYNIYEDNNDKKSLGLNLTYAFNDNANIGYTNYIGDDTPLGADTISHNRIFQNIFANYQVGKLKMQVGVDYILQQNSNIIKQNKTVDCLSGVLSFKFQTTHKFADYMRFELFNDPNGFMAGIITDKNNELTGLKLYGITYGLELKPIDNAYIRLEARELIMDKNQEIFQWNNKPQHNRHEVLLNLGISF